MTMSNTTNNWPRIGLVALRVAFIFFIIQILPIDLDFWTRFFRLEWSTGSFENLFGLTSWSPHFLSASHIPQWGIGSFANQTIAFLIALTGAAIWSLGKPAQTDYTKLYYWLRLLLRIRLSIAILPYGLIKLFHIQIPAPTLSDLNTAYGDFLPWKIYYLTTGASSAGYEATLGLLEAAGALLLLSRRTTLIGAALITALLTNITVANFAYRVGTHVYCTYLLSLALALVAYDIPRLYQLLVLRRQAQPDRFLSSFGEKNKRKKQLAKAIYLLLVLSFTIAIAIQHHTDRWPYPSTAGIRNSAGYYNVREFSINGRLLPYSLTDSTRWQNVVFEKWNTLTIRINKPVAADLSRPAIEYQPDLERTYESAGNGGRLFYSYLADTANNLLHLQHKNGNAAGYNLAYQQSGDSLLTLTGTTNTGDSVRIILERNDKKYLLKEGRRVPRKI